MKTYHPPDWEPIPIFEEWVAGMAERFGLGAITAEQVGLGAFLATMLVVALVLSLRSRSASSGVPAQQAERE